MCIISIILQDNTIYMMAIQLWNAYKKQKHAVPCNLNSKLSMLSISSHHIHQTGRLQGLITLQGLLYGSQRELILKSHPDERLHTFNPPQIRAMALDCTI
ncbi:hypothetical protein IHE45_08G089500 [Dioscorea alata]|uniref:Uncharacterized protein n=1 Tax=Dioscorea alata TaxID=55571 RepID=A0ACB7VK76_DIOAL|nr:hypothetical protein IHE45_08G089500 [Dioscorea alata]